MPHLIGQLSAEDACAVIANAILPKAPELSGYDYIVVVRAQSNGQASMLSSLAENETIITTLRRLLDHLVGGGRNMLARH